MRYVVGPWCLTAVPVSRSRDEGKVMAQRSLMLAGLAAAFASGIPDQSTGHDWYMGLTNSAH
jgi:hypothetical protein